MKNLIKDIEQNCKDLSIKGIVKFLNDRGDFSYTANYHREIYYFFIEARNCGYTLRESKALTVELFNISPETFKKIRARFKDQIKSDKEKQLRY